jgi:long-chain acyl-CoA synthetase
MNLAENLTETATLRPGTTAIKLDDFELSYAALDAASARVAGALRAQGIEPGDRVGLMLPNVPPFAIAYYGIVRAGAVVVPMNVLLKRREVAFYLENSGAKLLLAWHQFADEAQAGADDAGVEHLSVEPAAFAELLAGAEPLDGVEPREAQDTAVILYTSGTTGTPKGAELTHGNLTSNVAAVLDLFAVGSEDVIFGGLPLFHAFGQTCALNAGVAAGAMLTLLPRFDPGAALEIVQRDGVTIFEGVPTMYTALLNYPERAEFDTATLRVCVSGGAALPVEVLRGFEEAFNCVILEGYGLSETSPVATFNHPDRPRKPGSIGTPITGVEIKVVDADGNDVPDGEVGEIAIRGSNVMKQYWQRPDATAEVMRGGWFHTGDMATRDDDGFLFIVDRKKDMIIRGGYNVYPREIEEVLYEHPAVLECAVVGLPHSELGEEVGAAVVLRDNAGASAEDLREHVKSQVAAYKYPRNVWFLDELPKGPTGKILKREIEIPTTERA